MFNQFSKKTVLKRCCAESPAQIGVLNHTCFCCTPTTLEEFHGENKYGHARLQSALYVASAIELNL